MTGLDWTAGATGLDCGRWTGLDWTAGAGDRTGLDWTAGAG